MWMIPLLPVLCTNVLTRSLTQMVIRYVVSDVIGVVFSPCGSLLFFPVNYYAMLHNQNPLYKEKS